MSELHRKQSIAEIVHLDYVLA